MLALKGNEGTCIAMRKTYHYAQETNFEDIAHDLHETVEKRHGRIETRRHWIISEPEFMESLNADGAWVGLRALEW